jgi:hypothetical protein
MQVYKETLKNNISAEDFVFFKVDKKLIEEIESEIIQGLNENIQRNISNNIPFKGFVVFKVEKKFIEETEIQNENRKRSG